MYTTKKCKEKVYISVHFLTILDHQKPGSIPSVNDLIISVTGIALYGPSPRYPRKGIQARVVLQTQLYPPTYSCSLIQEHGSK